MRQGTTSVVPKKQQNDVGLHRLRKNSCHQELCNRARLQPGRKRHKIKTRALAPAKLSLQKSLAPPFFRSLFSPTVRDIN
jgi:hypothetical protein